MPSTPASALEQSPTAAVRPAVVVPGAVGNPVLVSKTQVSVTLSWSAPIVGSSSVNNYAVRYSTDGSQWTLYNGLIPSTSVTVSGLTRGTGYLFEVAAESLAGTGLWSSSVAAIPASVPAAPRSLSLTGTTTTSVSLSWLAPDDGGREILDYVTQYSSDGSHWSTFNDGVSTALAVTVSGLARGTEYQFRVSAINAEGSSTNASEIAPSPGALDLAATQLGSGAEHSCARLWTGTVECWGLNDEGQMGNGVTNYPSGSPPVSVTGISNAIQVDAGWRHSCAILLGGTVKCWGFNGNYELGRDVRSSLIPVEVPGVGTAAELSVGSSHSCVVLIDGTLRCWGFAMSGQLGNGVYQVSSGPVQVSYITTAVHVSAGHFFTCAVLTNGSVRCWGGGYSGQLGDAYSGLLDSYESLTPVPVTGISSATQIATGDSHACALLSSGAVKCWGLNSSGQLGDGTTTLRNAPVEVIGITTAVEIAAAGSHTCVLLTDGTIRCWGSNYSGALGNGRTYNSSTPVQVSGITNATQISAGGGYSNNLYGGDFSCALLSDGPVVCWGANSIGQLDSASGSYTSTPVPMSSITAARPLFSVSTAASVPGSPNSLNTTLKTQSSVSLSWVAADAGGRAISDYVVQYSTDGVNWQTYGDGVSTTTSTTVLGLTRGISYRFRVAAVNGLGQGGWSTPIVEIPASTPSAPATPSPTDQTSSSVTLSWVAPDNGGRLITDYVVQYSTDGSSWSTFNDGIASAATATVSGLTRITNYWFRVAAVNAEGAGPMSAELSASTNDRLAPPIDLRATAGDRQASLSWTAPSDGGGSPIIDYLIERSVDQGEWTAVPHDASAVTSYTVTGLRNNHSYRFRVSAVNAAGAGATALSNSVFLSPTLPRAPEGFAGPLASAAQLTWTAPDDGGRPILDYVIQYSKNGGSWTNVRHGKLPKAALKVIRLSNGSTYRFRVAARTAVGTGPFTEFDPVVPRTVPGAPRALKLVARDQHLDVSWTVPLGNGGAVITDYVLQYSTNGRVWTTVADGVSASTSATITGLENGVKYQVRVAAVNEAGTGKPVRPKKSSPRRNKPGTPINLILTPGVEQIAVSWTAPTDDGGTPVTDYLIQYSINGIVWVSLVDEVSVVPSASIPGLLSSVKYWIRVAASNIAGTGSFTRAKTAYPVGPAT